MLALRDPVVKGINPRLVGNLTGPKERMHCYVVQNGSSMISKCPWCEIAAGILQSSIVSVSVVSVAIVVSIPVVVAVVISVGIDIQAIQTCQELIGGILTAGSYDSCGRCHVDDGDDEYKQQQQRERSSTSKMKHGGDGL